MGSNYSHILNLPEVDPFYTISNNVWDVYEIYGIEAARSCLINELNDVMGKNDLASRHAELLISLMTNQGILVSVDRYGANKNDSGVWVRASFEETVTQLTKAATFNEVDIMTGPSGNIMFGQICQMGTGIKLGLDLTKIKSQTVIKVNSARPQDKKVVKIEIKEKVQDLCAADQFDFQYSFD
jgi:DNA-directed RNA polymerase beta' subunit